MEAAPSPKLISVLDPENRLNERITAITGYNMAEMTNEVANLQVKHDYQRAFCDYLEEQSKIILAESEEVHRNALVKANLKPTVQQVSNHARSSRAYKTHIERLLEERLKLAEMSAAYWGARSSVEVAINQLSYAKKELELAR